MKLPRATQCPRPQDAFLEEVSMIHIGRKEGIGESISGQAKLSKK